MIRSLALLCTAQWALCALILGAFHLATGGPGRGLFLAGIPVGARLVSYFGAVPPAERGVLAPLSTALHLGVASLALWRIPHWVPSPGGAGPWALALLAPFLYLTTWVGLSGRRPFR